MNIQDLKNQLNAARDEAKKNFVNLFEEVWKNAELKSFAWVQYTPYFNDGDICEFGVHCNNWCLSINDSDLYNGNYEDFEKEVKLIVEIVNQFDSDDLKYMFGEGKVRVTRDGVEIHDYDHD